MEQFRQLQAKSFEITEFLWTCPLTRSEAWTFYYACYLTSVGYPLACSSLTTSQLDDIQRKRCQSSSPDVALTETPRRRYCTDHSNSAAQVFDHYGFNKVQVKSRCSCANGERTPKPGNYLELLSLGFKPRQEFRSLCSNSQDDRSPNSNPNGSTQCAGFWPKSTPQSR